MKKIYFSLLMISAMFMVASCGNKSNSSEATQEEVNEVTFTDPAITYLNGIDLTSYFSAESLTLPCLKENGAYHHLSTNVKLKLLKKPTNIVTEGFAASIVFHVKFCDENGSTLEKGIVTRLWKDFNNISEGSIITLDATSERGEALGYEMKNVLNKVAKIEVSIGTYELKLAETAESKE